MSRLRNAYREVLSCARGDDLMGRILRKLGASEIGNLVRGLQPRCRPAVQEFLRDMPLEDTALLARLARFRWDWKRCGRITLAQRNVIWRAIDLASGRGGDK